MMKNLRDEINEIAQQLNLSNEDLQLVRLTRYKQILVSVFEKFTNLKKTTLNIWWWEHFLEPRYSFHSKDVFEVLLKLIDNNEIVWFIIEDKRKEQEHFWLYEGKISAIISILKELHFEEYYIVSKKFEWIVCENHHNLLIGSGKSIVEKIKSLDENAQGEAQV